MKRIDRDILALAVPALGALVAEPLFLLTDAAMIGHLGVVPLAGLGLAGAVLQTVIGLLVFLAYTTTPAVARRVGLGDERGAVRVGVDGLWLAAAIGVVVAAGVALAARPVVALFGAEPDVAAAAVTYLVISTAGIPAMLIVFAATGLLRGLQDTRTPLAVAGLGFLANAGLNAVLIYGAGLGLAGSAVGGVIAQWGMVAAYLVVVRRHARRTGASVRASVLGIRGSARAGGWLLLRAVSLRAAMLLTVAAAGRLGTDELAAFQIVLTVFSTCAFALDALAIAAQALVGRGLGAGDVATVRAVLRRCLAWGVGSGLVVAAILAASSPWAGLAFTGDPEIAAILAPGLLVLAVGAPLAGIVFVLDGVLIGAGDARYLALTGIVNVAAYAPLAVAVIAIAPSGGDGVGWLTAAFALGYLAARAATLWPRARGTRWMRTGA